MTNFTFSNIMIYSNQSINTTRLAQLFDLKSTLTMLVLFLTAQVIFSQSAGYSVYSSDKEHLGQLKVSSINADTATKISVISQFKVKMLITVEVKYTLQSLYSKGELVSNYIKTYRNDELHSFSRTTKVGSQYKFVKDNIESNYNKQISFSESLLYFNEPVGIGALYSEFDGVEKTIVQVSSGHYKIKNPLNGNISEYYYENGVLKTAIVHFQIMTLYLTREN